MADNDMSKDVLNIVKKKTGKSVSPKDIQKLASGVTPSTLTNETQLRQLIKQVAGLVNVQVSDSLMNEIIDAVKKSKINPNSMEQIMKLIMKK